MKPLTEQHFLSLDGESLGLHGRTFAWATCLGINGTILETAAYHLPMRKAIEIAEEEGDVILPADKDWVEANVTIPKSSKEVQSFDDLQQAFWTTWLDARRRFPGVLLLAEVPWPVESNLLSWCIHHNPSVRSSFGPYPIIDVANLLLAARINPLDIQERLEDETPAHNPLCDSRQSLRIGIECLKKAGW